MAHLQLVSGAQLPCPATNRVCQSFQADCLLQIVEAWLSAFLACWRPLLPSTGDPPACPVAATGRPTYIEFRESISLQIFNTAQRQHKIPADVHLARSNISLEGKA